MQVHLDGPHDPQGDGDTRKREQDSQPRWRMVVCMAVLVPVIGGAGGEASSLFEGSSPAAGWLRLGAAIVLLLALFLVICLGFIWTVNKAHSLILQAKERWLFRRAERASVTPEAHPSNLVEEGQTGKPAPTRRTRQP